LEIGEVATLSTTDSEGNSITMIYLADQIQKNTTSNRTSAYQSVVASISNWSTGLAMSKSMTRIIRVGMVSNTELGADAKAQLNMMIVSLLRHYENMHVQYVSGFISEETWAGGWLGSINGTLEPVGARKVWDSQRMVFSASFCEFVESSDPWQYQRKHHSAWINEWMGDACQRTPAEQQLLA
jgi:hypothetical protein